MSHILVQEPVDIFQLPTADERYQTAPGTQVSIGDLHGNTMKLIFLLIKHGIAKNLTAGDYDKLVAIYKTKATELSKEDLRTFNLILDKIQFNTDSKLRLIGDELADRGNNDYFTLKVLEKLHKNKVPVEILISNHGVEFIEACEIQGNFHAPMLSLGGHAPSLENLQTIVERGLVSREEIIDLTNRAYKPSLKAISYSLNEDQSNITLYSHAAIGINTIKKVAEKLGVPYADASAVELAQTIDAINELFQAYVDADAVHYLYSREQMEAGYMGYADLSDAPFELLMWNRLYNEEIIQRPDKIGNYTLNYVHGHDSSDPKTTNNYNLDNSLGKFEHLNQGEYTVLYSHETQLNKLNIENPERKAHIEPIIKRVDKALTGLNNKIAKVEQHKFAEAHGVATELLTQLQKAKQNYEKYLLIGMNEQHAQKIFTTACEKAISKAKPVLERDLSWGEFLTNFLKAIANAVISMVSTNHSFFKLAIPESVKAVERLQEALGVNEQGLTA